MSNLSVSAKPKLLFLVAEDWYFCSHRLPLAIAARDAGYEVCVVTRIAQHADEIRASGLSVIPLRHIRRSGLCPTQELTLIHEIWNIYRCEKPDIVHQVGLKPVVYGSFVAHLLGIHGVVNALAGLGFVFSSQRLLAVVLRPVIKILFFWLFKSGNSFVIVQNEHDRDVLATKVGISLSSIRLIRGAGVDLTVYRKREASRVQPPLVVLIARMLWDKGVGDFVEAAIRIRDVGLRARFALIGIPDPENPTSVPESQLRAWHDSEKIEWWGYRSDIPDILAMASIACLPTFYGEGLPKALIEAMASECAIITTNIPGCHELVDCGRNGIAVPPGDITALTEALKVLISDPESCRKMGVAGRLMVEQMLSQEQVLKETLILYTELVRTKVIS
jgi:glycosyltransferase involved in cell wall biosynthesis